MSLPTKSFVERLNEAVALPDELWEQADWLAHQLDGSPVVPLIGAGTSLDCGQALAGEISDGMCKRYEAQFGPPLPTDLSEKRRDLGVVADALYAAGNQESVIDALGLADRSKWPDKGDLVDHFCTYRVLARLAREGFFSEAITLNYDCAFERGLEDEGFLFSPGAGGAWLNRVTVVPDGAAHVKLERRGEMVLTKAHGCAATYRRNIKEPLTEEERAKVEEAIIIRRGQLLDWRTDLWARDLFADRARRHVILMLGISGQDPVIHIALTRVLEEVYRHLGIRDPCPEPRVVVIDLHPDTVALRTLVHQGCGRVQPSPDVVTRLQIPADASMTSVMIALATQMLARRLEREGGMSLPMDPVLRVISLMVAAPASLRWAFRLERRSRGIEFHQRSVLERVGSKGYVPITVGPQRAAESLRVRNLLRVWLGLPAEKIEEAVIGQGFISSWKRGRAFLPLGVTGDELRAIPEADLVTHGFPGPASLEHVLVAADNGGLIGRSVQTGTMVKLT